MSFLVCGVSFALLLAIAVLAAILLAKILDAKNSFLATFGIISFYIIIPLMLWVVIDVAHRVAGF